MNGTGKHSFGRLGVTSAATAVVAVTAIVAAVLSVSSAASRTPGPGATARGTRAAPGTQAASGTLARSAGRGPVPGASGSVSGGSVTGAGRANAGPVSLVLTAADHRDCPAGATACVDLTRHITWLQAGDRVTFGPVQMEPGKPGGGHETPRGTFHVAWKAGAVYESTTYHEPMPWATFFAVGGIAFHGGPLAKWSHGCVHLTDSNAHYYNVHLPVGAEVVVF